MMGADLISPAPRREPLRRVAYEGFEWDDEAPSGAGFDVVSMAVRLGFEDEGSFALRWCVWQPFECLTTSAELTGSASPLVRVLDVSGRWQHLLGGRVVAQRVAMQETTWGPQPWACRLSFDNGGSLVVCLGELTPDGVPVYSPDSLLVTDSREHANAYRLAASTGSAWIEELGDADCQ